MAIKRYGTEEQSLPFARAVSAGGWLYISGQVPMKNGEIVEGGIIEQSRLAIDNCLTIMREAEYSLEDAVHVTVILTDARYFQSFNKVFREVFGEHPPARICVISELAFDSKVEVDLTCYKASE